ncbi:MAG: FlgD immunoglobulin-like domain containing protein [Candidatus Latescibacterota bacterium]
MKLVRTVSLIALAVACGVGLLAGSADAAVLDSVRVVTPDSGAIRGIDSLITTEVFFRTTHSDSSNITVWWWLATKGTATDTVTDGTPFAKSDTLSLASGRTPALGASSPVVAVRTTVDQSDIQAGTAVDGDMETAPALGTDVDTVIVEQGPTVSAGRSWKVTIRYTLDAAVGEQVGITAYANVYDTPAGAFATTSGMAAARSKDFRVDGLRPVASSATAMSVQAADPRGEVAVQGFTAGTLDVVGIGDTVKIGYDLGTQADQIILQGNLRLSAQLAGAAVSLGTIQQRVDSAFVVIQSGQFANVSQSSTTGEVALFLTDPAGNLSSDDATDAVPVGLTSTANFLIDATPPALDAQVTGALTDTILPVNTDTISDGGIRNDAVISSWLSFSDDLNPMVYNLGEALYTLSITFDNADNSLDRNYVIPNTGGVRSVASNLALSQNQNRRVDLPNTQNAQAVIADSELYVFPGGPTDSAQPGEVLATVTDTSLATGTYTITFQGTDVAGNAGPALSRTNVYVDVADISLGSRFPTKLAFGPVTTARLDTIEEATAQVQFQLGEPADSVLIIYQGIAGTDNGSSRTRRLSGSQLTNTAAVQTFAVDSLKSQTTYALAILARDLVGNYTVAGPDTFRYDTSFVVPIIRRFRIAAAKSGMETADSLLAGSTNALTITADATTDGSRDAVTYKAAAILKVTGGQGVTLTGTGVTDLGGGRALLDAASWLAGQRTVTLKDTVAEEQLAVTIVDSTSTGGPYVGALDSLIHYTPNAYSQIVVSAPASVGVGTPFNVNLRLADLYGNRQILSNNKYVMVSATKLGVQLPASEIYVAGGQTTFQATATMDVDSLTIRARDVAAGAGSPIQGVSGLIDVVAAAEVAIDAPDTLLADDYLGADGQGDQGGFVMLTWALSDDHGTLDGYRIYRQVLAPAGLDAEGNVVSLDEGEQVYMPWAFVDAVPGEDVGRAIVATLDNVATLWAIAAERGGQTSAKEAFGSVASISAAYELMAQTMAASKVAQVEGPVFATLTPEALSYIQSGVAPRMRTTGTVEQSQLVETSVAVRAVDNIPPAAVGFLRAADTPADAGASITVTWSKSASDRVVVSSVPTAVGLGSTTYQVEGVAGYNVYRRVGEGAFALVGQAGPGETSLADVTALNGVRYTYKVSPFDLDNVTETTLERSAMAIRNNVVDAQGVPVQGLFGMDNTVGFDDFFVFADNFGLTAADEAFEPAFDLDPNARIDFEDFFRFADNFGRVAAGVGKVVPTMAGLNTDARLYLTAGAALPKVGEEVALQLSLADFVELKGYGFSVSYDPQKLEFVRVVRQSDALGAGELAAPQIVSQTDGEVAVAAYGEAVSEGEVGLSVVFRTKTEIEESFVEVSASQVRDGNYANNLVALPAPVQIQTRPEAFALKDNYPNPFNPATTIKYALPEGAFVKLEVFNVVGQVVRTLVADRQNAGRYVVQWDATNDSGHSLSSGIYFYRLQAGSEFTQVNKMLLLK